MQAPEITIIFAFRNRETSRIKRCFDSLARQSYTNFNVIFVDSGSEPTFAQPVQQLCEAYPFITYLYHQTRGLEWNKPHALNVAIKAAETKYILSSDIDLIFSQNHLQHIVELAGKYDHVYSEVYWLDKKFNNWESLNTSIPTGIKSSGEGGKGGVHLMRKTDLEKVEGYDENFKYWGFEDIDLHNRLTLLGLSHGWANHHIYPVFHQWHPKVSISNWNAFPDKFWENMNIYHSLNHQLIKRNKGTWGELYSDENRPVLKVLQHNSFAYIFDITKGGTPYNQVYCYDDIIKKLCQLKQGESIKIMTPKPMVKKKYNKVQKTARFVAQQCIRIARLDLALVPGFFEKMAYKHRHFIPFIDIKYLVYYLLQNTSLISDYYIAESNTNNTYILVK